MNALPGHNGAPKGQQQPPLVTFAVLVVWLAVFGFAGLVAALAAGVLAHAAADLFNAGWAFWSGR